MLSPVFDSFAMSKYILSMGFPAWGITLKTGKAAIENILRSRRPADSLFQQKPDSESRRNCRVFIFEMRRFHLTVSSTKRSKSGHVISFSSDWVKKI